MRIGRNGCAQVNARRPTRRATRQSILRLHQQQDGPPILLGQAVGDNAEHAGMPMRIQQEQHLPIQQRRLTH